MPRRTRSYVAAAFALITCSSGAISQGPDSTNGTCSSFFVTAGLISSITDTCNFHGEPEQQFIDTLKSCEMDIGTLRARDLFQSGTAYFSKQRKTLGDAEACRTEFEKHWDMVGRSRFIQLEEYESKLHELFDSGRLADALEVARHWESDAARLVGRTNKEYAEALKGLTIILMNLQYLDEAISGQNKLLALEEQLYGSKSDRVAQSLNNLVDQS